MWKRRAPNELTAREREVLELLRRGLTNEEIAERLRISVAGAKYHVSQILSKLGVGTREEAAALSLDDRRRRWAGWPLWAPIAVAATVAATAATFAVASTIYDSSWDEDDNATLAAEQYAPSSIAADESSGLGPEPWVEVGASPNGEDVVHFPIGTGYLYGCGRAHTDERVTFDECSQWWLWGLPGSPDSGVCREETVRPEVRHRCGETTPTSEQNP